MTLKERYEAAKTALAETKSALEAGEKTADDLQNTITEFETVQAQMKAAEDAEKLMSGLKKNVEKPADNEEEKIMPRTLGENFVEAVKAAEVGKKFTVIAPAYKAAADTQASPAAAVDWATTFDQNVVTGARVALVIRDLFGAETISGSTLQYLVEGALEGAPAVTAEGAKKPQIHFADPEPVTVALKKIACYIKESDEYIDDYPFLASAINGRLLYELGLVEQNTLVADLLATSGILTGSVTSGATAADTADAILKAAMDVQENSGFAADAIVLNPADWYTLRVGRDGEQRYYGGGYFGEQAIPTLWGMPVCVTPAVAAGTIIVGAFKTCGSVVSKGGVSVEAANTNEDDFVKNLMTIRAEERLALAVRRPAGFCKITKA